MRTLATLATLLLGLAVVFWAPAAKAHCPNHAHCGEATLGGLSCSMDQIARYDGTNWVCSTGALTCSSGQVAKFNGSIWECAADADTDTNTDTLADLPSCLDGDVAKFDGEDWNCESSSPPGAPSFILMDCADLNCARDPQPVGTVINVKLDSVLVFLTIQDLSAQPRNIVLQVSRAKIFNRNPSVWFDGVDCSGSAWIQINSGDPGIAGGSDGDFFPPAIEDYAINSDTADQTVRALWVATNDTVFSGTSVSRAHSQGCIIPRSADNDP